MSFSETTTLFSGSDTSSIATVNYKTFSTSQFQNSKIPKFSTILTAGIEVTIKSSLSAKGDLYFAFSNRSGGDGEPNGTKISNFGACVGDSSTTKSASLLPYIHSANANAGKYNGSYPYFLYWATATLPRKWTLSKAIITYDFDKPKFTINVQSNNSEWGAVSGGGTWDVETTDFTKTISATPKANYHFVKWSDGDTNASRAITISQDCISAHSTTETYEAVFAPDAYTITVNASPGGTVSGGGTYEYGKSVTLAATPNTGYIFKQWSDGNTSNPRTVTVTSNVTYTAEFALDKVNKIYVGNSLVKGVYVGNTPVKAVYVGSTKIYG